MRTAYDDVMSAPIQIPDGIEFKVTLTDRRDPNDVFEQTFEPILSREAIFRDWTQVMPFVAAYMAVYGDLPAAPAAEAEGREDDVQDGE